jgi:rhodanese-related sulfurtransferase/predicted transcriptional regulator
MLNRMERREAKTALFDGLAAVAKALGNGRRAEIVELLSQGERSVEEIADLIGQSVANTSQHLRLLAHAGLVQSRREGLRVFYSLSGPSVAALWRAIRDVATEQVAEVERLAAAYLGDQNELTVMTRDELARRLPGLTVIDVRPPAEYNAGHIAGARSVPLDEVPTAALPKRRPVVAYCRGPYCVYADDAARTLVGRGYRVYRLEDGYPEWAAAGLPVSRGVS